MEFADEEDDEGQTQQQGGERSLVEDARAAIRAARLAQKREARAKVLAEAKREHDWAEYQDILFSNLPTRLAQREGSTSFGPAMQTVYIEKAEEELRRRSDAERVPTAGADPALQRLMGLQNSQGFWELTPELVAAMGGHVPDPPEGVVDWRWATACALAFLRRRPDQHKFVGEVHDKGVDWVQPPWLLEAARDSLPPDDCYFDLDETAVKERRWRDSERINFRTSGYEAFVQPPPEELPDASVTTESTTASEWVARQRRGAAATPSKKEKGPSVTDPRRLANHMDSLARDFNLLTKRTADDGSEASTSTLRAAGRDVTKLRDAWTRPVGLREERARLEKSRAAPREATPWDGDTKILPRLVKQRDGGGVHGAPRRPRPQSDLDASSSSATTQPATKATPPKGSRRSPRSNGGELVFLDESSAAGGLDEYSMDAARKELDKAQIQVVDAIAQYDRYRREINAVAVKCARAYRTARLHSQRQDAFDELTEMLGPYRWARAGFNDWRGRPVKGMQTITIKLVESVVRWRAALAATGRSLGANAATPFRWENRNVLLSVITGLDFLGETFPELVHWYSPEYVFKRNPLCRACVLDERPPTPPVRPATRSILFFQPNYRRRSRTLPICLGCCWMLSRR